MKATSKQKQIIHLESPTRDIKEELVQWATDDNDKISTNDLSFDQANKILIKLGKRAHSKVATDSAAYWGYFDFKNQQHKYILSLLRQMNWTTVKNGKEVADMERFGQWLQTKAPRKTPLKKMSGGDVRVTISILEKMAENPKNYDEIPN